MWGMRRNGCMFVIGKLRDSIAMKEKVQKIREDESNGNTRTKGSRARIGMGLGLKGKAERERGRPVLLPMEPKGSKSSNCVFIFFFFASFFLPFASFSTTMNDGRKANMKTWCMVYTYAYVCVCMCECLFVTKGMLQFSAGYEKKG